MMENDYDASFDVGVAVKEELPEATAKSKKKEKRRGRSSNGMRQLGSTSSANDDAGKILDGEVINNAGRTDDYVSSPAVSGNAGAERKSKKKRKRDRSSNSNADDGIPEGFLKSSMHTELTDGLERKQKNSLLLPPLPLKGMFINERKNLPVYQHSAEIVDLISNNDVVLVVAETVSRTLSFDEPMRSLSLSS
jgi:hypothetical protein